MTNHRAPYLYICQECFRVEKNDWILILIHMNHRTRPVKLQYHVSDWMETYAASTTCETLIRHETRLSDPVSTVVISFIVSWDRGTR